MFLANLLKSALTKQRCGIVTGEEKIRETVFRNGALKKKLNKKT
jgi:hypothetical protein